ncbi:MAG: hypothetical protein VX747_01060, partial [Actinomycetota bacterium]|nr:hypothetical protein [Actinomycetota bacterium]
MMRIRRIRSACAAPDVALPWIPVLAGFHAAPDAAPPTAVVVMPAKDEELIAAAASYYWSSR